MTQPPRDFSDPEFHAENEHPQPEPPTEPYRFGPTSDAGSGTPGYHGSGPATGPAPAPGPQPGWTAPAGSGWHQQPSWSYPGYQPGYAGYGDSPAAPAQTPAAGSAGRRVAPLIVTAAVAAVVGAAVAFGTVSLAGPGTVNSGIRVTTSTAAPAAKLDGTVAAAAAHIQPSVVTIQVAGNQEQGTGSGVVIRSDGYILTNDHVASVASGGGSITVQTNDGRSASAKIVGEDASDDLAVIKVDLPNLTAATFGKSAGLVVGQSVVAVGAPLGLSDTVTSGIVSATARPVRAGDQGQAVFSAIQTDAAINPGNSGGPLVDLNGSVVGINSAIATASSGSGGLGQQDTSGNIGIGFAIPADEATRIAGELIATGKATHAVMDVTVSSRQASGVTGATLQQVNPGGAGAKAGLQSGDVVTKVDNQRIQDADGLIATIRSYAPGSKVTITYQRSGSSHTTDVTLGEAAS